MKLPALEVNDHSADAERYNDECEGECIDVHDFSLSRGILRHRHVDSIRSHTVRTNEALVRNIRFNSVSDIGRHRRGKLRRVQARSINRAELEAPIAIRQDPGLRPLATDD